MIEANLLNRIVYRLYLKAVFISVVFVSQVYADESQDPYLTVLGVGQDAGFPQAGCYKPHCLPGWFDASLRHGATSLGLIDPSSQRTYLFEATPNLPEQMFRLEQLAPSTSYDLSGVFLTHAHIGHYAGLMFFGHEAMGATNVPVYVMPRMKSFLENNGPWSQLVDFQNIQLRPLRNGRSEALGELSVTPFLVPHRDEFSETVGFRIEGPSKTAIFIPDIDKWSKWKLDIVDQVKAVDYALIDATFFGDGELPGRDMSKIPHPLVTQSMALFDTLSEQQRNKVWFIHMNHTNPLLDEDSEEFNTVRAKGFNVAIEGVKLPL